MNIAFISHDSGLYGASRSLLNLIEGLIRLNVNCYIVVPGEGKLTELLIEQKIPFAIRNYSPWVDGINHNKNLIARFKSIIKHRIYAVARLMTNIFQLYGLCKQLKAWNVDIVYTNTSVVPIGAVAAWFIGKPHIWHIREFKESDHNLSLDWGYIPFKFLLDSAAAQILISKVLKEHLQKYLTEGKTHLVYNGIAFKKQFDMYLGQREAQASSNTRPFTFAVVGFMSAAKGQTDALRALALIIEKYPDTKLILIGKGGRAGLQQLIHDLNIEESVEIWGHIDEPYRAYMAADALLMCSRNEAFGRVTVEAMSTGLPVIGLDNAGTSEIIENESSGLLYDGTVVDLASCMERFVQNPDLAKKLGRNGWEMAKEKYDIESYSQKIHDVLVSVTKEKNQN